MSVGEGKRFISATFHVPNLTVTYTSYESGFLKNLYLP